MICVSRALTPLFWNGARAHGIGKISNLSTKIWENLFVFMYEVSIARLIPKVNLSLFLDIFEALIIKQCHNLGIIWLNLFHFLRHGMSLVRQFQLNEYPFIQAFS